MGNIMFTCNRCPESFKDFEGLVTHFEANHRVQYDAATEKELKDLNALRKDELVSHFPHLFRD